MRRTSAVLLSAMSLLVAVPAAAQEVQAPASGAYVGAVAGYHDLGADLPGDDGGFIGGGVVGFDLPTTGNLAVGVEGNFSFGTGAIDSEYGVAARVGYKLPSGGLLFVRGGYQWVNLDVGNAAGVDIDEDDFDIDDVAQDYLAGVGGEFPLGTSRTRLRIAVDTISFDSVRGTAGVILGF